MNWQFPVHITGARATISKLINRERNVTKTEESCLGVIVKDHLISGQYLSKHSLCTVTLVEKNPLRT